MNLNSGTATDRKGSALFPAGAGMNRSILPRRPFRSSVPRRRGDEPHVVALKDGHVQDRWDCRGYYWQGYGDSFIKQLRERKAMTIWVSQTKLFKQLLAGMATS